MGEITEGNLSFLELGTSSAASSEGWRLSHGNTPWSPRNHRPQLLCLLPFKAQPSPASSPKVSSAVPASQEGLL